jgi:predicted flap endonuclease-1-like 5' DNA nuclease
MTKKGTAVFRREGDRGDSEQVFHEFQLANEVILCPLLGRAYVIVADYAISVAERLAPTASAKSGWAVKVMTRQELDKGMGQAVAALRELDGVDAALGERLMGEGVLSYRDLASIAPDKLAQLIGIPIDQAENLIGQAEEKERGT